MKQMNNKHPNEKDYAGFAYTHLISYANLHETSLPKYKCGFTSYKHSWFEVSVFKSW